MGLMYAVQMPQNLLRNVFLIWETFLNQENIRKFFSKQEDLSS